MLKIFCLFFLEKGGNSLFAPEIFEFKKYVNLILDSTEMSCRFMLQIIKRHPV